MNNVDTNGIAHPEPTCPSGRYWWTVPEPCACYECPMLYCDYNPRHHIAEQAQYNV